jgi:hypothetical protein
VRPAGHRQRGFGIALQIVERTARARDSFTAHALTRQYELSGFDAVARYGVDGYGRMARRIAILVQAQFGFLGVSRQQCTLGDLGLARGRVRAHFAADLSRLFEHSRSAEERSGTR